MRIIKQLYNLCQVMQKPMRVIFRPDRQIHLHHQTGIVYSSTITALLFQKTTFGVYKQ